MRRKKLEEKESAQFYMNFRLGLYPSSSENRNILFPDQRRDGWQRPVDLRSVINKLGKYMLVTCSIKLVHEIGSFTEGF